MACCRCSKRMTAQIACVSILRMCTVQTQKIQRAYYRKEHFGSLRGIRRGRSRKMVLHNKILYSLPSKSLNGLLLGSLFPRYLEKSCFRVARGGFASLLQKQCSRPSRRPNGYMDEFIAKDIIHRCIGAGNLPQRILLFQVWLHRNDPYHFAKSPFVKF